MISRYFPSIPRTSYTNSTRTRSATFRPLGDYGFGVCFVIRT